MFPFRESFEKDGFAISPAGLTATETKTLLHDLSHAPAPGGRAGIRHILRRPSIASVARDFRFLGIAQAILGAEAFPFRATLFDKSPERNWLIAWHQDTALPLRERREIAGWGPWSLKDGIVYAHAPAAALRQIVALRIHLDESTSQNGPLRVLPGTHRLGVLSDDQIHRLSTQVTEVSCGVPCGGVLAMSPLLVHSSSKSRTADARRVLHVEYAAGPIVDGGMSLAVA
jgi:hypothetical protein